MMIGGCDFAKLWLDLQWIIAILEGTCAIPEIKYFAIRCFIFFLQLKSGNSVWMMFDLGEKKID